MSESHQRATGLQSSSPARAISFKTANLSFAILIGELFGDCVRDGEVMMIRHCGERDLGQIYMIINDGALAYKGVIPDDCWSEPYMPRHELQTEIAAGVTFWGWEQDGALCGVMGLQQVQDVTLIRHAYVLTKQQRRGIGAGLLSHLMGEANGPMLIGTWANALWAIHFYQKNGFRLVGRLQKDRLLRTYWNVPARQMEVSVVLADVAWWNLNQTRPS
jgi:N-acetylglutamate synthase-like GNAT family acetyltransferase